MNYGTNAINESGNTADDERYQSCLWGVTDLDRLWMELGTQET